MSRAFKERIEQVSTVQSKVRALLDLSKLKCAGLDPYTTQKQLHTYFASQGFSYQRHLGYVRDENLASVKWLPIIKNLNAIIPFEYFYDFDTGVIEDTTSSSESESIRDSK